MIILGFSYYCVTLYDFKNRALKVFRKYGYLWDCESIIGP